ncbi:MAG: glycosyltransferase family A protein [Prevotellaceae bacterium]|nr:glycosyltransferase family A protein [Prevotellaceae bacterium]
MKFSIIIPAYNDKGTLEECLGSVLSQGFDDMEVIVVDDGSETPVSIERSPIVNLIRITHAGLSAARNAGISIAKGDYLLFIDSDDWIERGTLKVLCDAVDANPDCDIIEYPINIHEGGQDEHKLVFEDKNYQALIDDYWLGCKAYRHSYACNKVFKRDLFASVEFPVGKKFEDVHTLPKLLDASRKVMTISQGLYHYMWNQEGICAKAGMQDLTQLLEAHINVMEKWTLAEKKGFSEYFMHVLNIQIDVYKAGGKVILPAYKIESFPMDIKTRIKYLGYNVLGINKLCKIWKYLS